MAEDEVGGSREEGPQRFVIQAEGEENVLALRLAEACLDESKGDVLRALVTLAGRALIAQSLMSTGMARGTVSIWPEEKQDG
ncbi:hypothetical protein [Aminobacter sp. MET-1]|uniref:hypothetical protein n=1 Tax=Aminobacter sp. MET-1 TaxID=2951085 RepID=UPI002269D71F|nr:hypothetical protein [Aminobacter sp. MET-1]MCX8571123.1 hypothetical protein [Aminobacter sp. MET-1]MCX8573208.1 hypothetical protein [Aminobacter sp. MET-1]